MVDHDEASVQRDLGRMETEIVALSQRLSSLTTTLDKNTQKLDTINRTLSEARGGWRVLMWVGGASAAGGALVSNLLTYLKGWIV